MFFNKTKLLEERLKLLTENIQTMKGQMDSQQNRIDQLKNQNNQLERIIQNYIPGEIHSVTKYAPLSELSEFYEFYTYKFDTYIYVSGKEFKFENLHLYNPSFTQSDQDNVIYVTDVDNEANHNSYILDTNTCQYIQTKKD